MEENKKELIMTRVFDAPRELVYKAWIDPKMVEKWWGPQGVFIPVCELDTKTGGKINIVMEAGEELGQYKGTQWPMKGEYVELDEPKKIVFKSIAINAGVPILESLVTVTFDEENGKTTLNIHVVVTDAKPGSEFAIKGMNDGWNQQFDKLVEFVNNMSK